jgi:UDP-N-acetylmuramate: L-alanyl-gamma-D-glutamyl-meso-diaminopimelate ligase
LIITALEFDHADIYADFETYQLAFKRLVNLVPRSGKIVIWGDEEAGPALRKAAEKAFCPVQTYGFAPQNDWVATDFNVTAERMRFTVSFRGNKLGEFAMEATGRHNVLNALAGIAVAHGRGISAADIAQALATFRSVKRRMDVKGEVNGVLVVDDFAHHPTAVTATIQAARARWPQKRIWAVLEPRSNSMRRKVFEDALPKALALGDHVILGAVFRAQQLGDENRMDPEAVAASVRALGKGAKVFGSAAAIAEEIAAQARPGDLVLVMSNGSFDGLCDKLLKRLGVGTAVTAEVSTK